MQQVRPWQRCQRSLAVFLLRLSAKSLLTRNLSCRNPSMINFSALVGAFNIKVKVHVSEIVLTPLLPGLESWASVLCLLDLTLPP